MKASDVEQALRAWYEAPEWAIFFNVASATGGAASRRADAIAMSLWPSRGLELHGFEIKVQRNDWLREKKDPAKAHEIARFCDRWWLAAAPDVVKNEEVPAAWGVLVCTPKGLIRERDAAKLDAQPVTREFLASVLRSASKANPAEEAIRKAVEAARAEEREAAKNAAEVADGHVRGAYERLQKEVDAFESASGIRISVHGGQQLGAAVRLITGGKYDVQEMGRAAARLRNSADQIDVACAEIAAVIQAGGQS